jgi:aspartyl/asparaginyl-tRNA synthetase
MDRVEIKRLYDDISLFLDSVVTVCGWIKTLRPSGAIAFVELSDGSCFKSCRWSLQRRACKLLTDDKNRMSERR